MWPNLSQMKPEPVPSTFAFSSSSSPIKFPELSFLGILVNSRSFMKTTEVELSYINKKKKQKFIISPPPKMQNLFATQHRRHELEPSTTLSEERWKMQPFLWQTHSHTQTYDVKTWKIRTTRVSSWSRSSSSRAMADGEVERFGFRCKCK